MGGLDLIPIVVGLFGIAEVLENLGVLTRADVFAGKIKGLFPTREDALTCERQIKGWARAKKEALMKGNWTRIQALSRLGKG